MVISPSFLILESITVDLNVRDAVKCEAVGEALCRCGTTKKFKLRHRIESVSETGAQIHETFPQGI